MHFSNLSIRAPKHLSLSASATSFNKINIAELIKNYCFDGIQNARFKDKLKAMDLVVWGYLKTLDE